MAKKKLGKSPKKPIVVDSKKSKTFSFIVNSEQAKKPGIWYFKTHVGPVKLTVEEDKDTGVYHLSWIVNEVMVPNRSIKHLLSPIKVVATKEGANKEAKHHLLLTNHQLSSTYKSKHFSRALEFMQYGKRPQRGKVDRMLKREKEITGREFVDIIRTVFGDRVPTHDLFTIFRMAHNQKNLLKHKK